METTMKKWINNIWLGAPVTLNLTQQVNLLLEMYFRSKHPYRHHTKRYVTTLATQAKTQTTKAAKP